MSLKVSAPLKLIGRSVELERMRACLVAGRNVLLEGPVGSGKTHLALAVTQGLKRSVFRVDGDGRYSEQKLSGWFDPPSVLKHGFSEKSFIPGPLVEAMRTGAILFINELNRLPEGVQNVLLPAIDERVISVPRLGEIRAADGFLVIATQNPKEFVATSHLSEAILDRFELVTIDYQSETEEVEIVKGRLLGKKVDKNLALAAVQLARLTRTHPRVRRGASIRAAMSVAELTAALMNGGMELKTAFFTAAIMGLSTRIEIEPDAEGHGSARLDVEELLREWCDKIFGEFGLNQKKK